MSISVRLRGVVMQSAFTQKPMFYPFINIVETDGLDIHRILAQIFGMRGLKCFDYRTSCQGIHCLFDGQQLIVELAGFAIATANQSVDSFRSEAEHAKTADVRNSKISNLVLFICQIFQIIIKISVLLKITSYLQSL